MLTIAGIKILQELLADGQPLPPNAAEELNAYIAGKTETLRRLQAQVQDARAFLNEATAGIKILQELLADGQPLPPNTAEELNAYIAGKTETLRGLQAQVQDARAFLNEATALARAIGKTRRKKGGA